MELCIQKDNWERNGDKEKIKDSDREMHELLNHLISLY